ncbi:hypothetical protein [Mycolicibacterium goodii]|uniref:hypothetical protein n=1 Tax=Mycolicibacterium goodii TaxID=134601 RepID=UPI00296FFC9B
MTADREDDGRAPEAPWHHSTPAVLGASVAALAVIALVVWGVVALTSNADNPQQAPIDFVEPSFASTTSRTTSSTTSTITSTSPPETTEFGLPPEGTDPSASLPPEGEESTSESTAPRTPPRTRSETDDEDDETPTTRNRPRTNVTRTLYPAPGN